MKITLRGFLIGGIALASWEHSLLLALTLFIICACTERSK